MQVYICKIIDSAAFNTVIRTKAFIDADKANAWMIREVKEERAAVVANGETDSAFIEAIHAESSIYEITE